MRIFISYRREDASGWVGRLSGALRRRFGRHNIFMDIDSLDIGVDFAESISKTIASCDVLLGVVGPRRISASSASGTRRLDERDDFVRLEIARALDLRVRVVPLLVGGARLPTAEQLPDQIKSFAGKQAHELSDSRWDYDVQRLIDALDRRWWRRKDVTVAGISLIIVLGGLAIIGSENLRERGRIVVNWGAPQQPATPLEVGYNFISNASKALWTNGEEELKVQQLITNDVQGIVAVHFRPITLEDGTTPAASLYTHPEQVVDGKIEGKYGPFVIGNNLGITCKVGFAMGAKRAAERNQPPLVADGVTFKIEFLERKSGRRQLLYSQFASDNGKMDECIANMSALDGQEGYIILAVEAGKTAWTDWAVWSDLKVSHMSAFSRHKSLSD